MSDPTYKKSEIEGNIVWHVAWVMSEVRNDNAPLGWGTYIPCAEELCRVFKIERAAALPQEGGAE